MRRLQLIATVLLSLSFALLAAPTLSTDFTGRVAIGHAHHAAREVGGEGLTGYQSDPKK